MSETTPSYVGFVTQTNFTFLLFLSLSSRSSGQIEPYIAQSLSFFGISHEGFEPVKMVPVKTDLWEFLATIISSSGEITPNASARFDIVEPEVIKKFFLNYSRQPPNP